MSRSARWAFAFIAGLLIGTLLLYGYALVGIHWTRSNISLPLLALTIWSALTRKQSDPEASARWTPASAGIIGGFLAVTLYAIADARATCGDLMYIWAPKAQKFYAARTIDTKFLSYVFYVVMHADYPPLVPLIYDVGSIFTHHFSMWSPLFLSPIILLSIVGVLRGFGGSPAAAALLMAVLSCGFVMAYLPGGADPFLLLFEAVALIALTFEPESAESRWIAAAALAGAAFSKVEGATFAIIIAVAFVLTQRRIVRAITLIVPAAALLATWLLFVWHNKLFDQYARAHQTIRWSLLSSVANAVMDRAAYRVFWLPWIAAAAPLFVTRFQRRAALPLLVAAGSIAAAIFFYLHDPGDPAFWIATSANRVLVTPLMCIAIASAATWDDRQPDAGGSRLSSRAP